MGSAMINLALIGSGYWGSKIVETLQSNKDVGQIQIIDIKNGGTIANINDDITTAIISTPLWDHYSTATALLDRGFDCYIEKPMAETVAECEQIAKYADKQTIMVGHIFLYHPCLEFVKQSMTSIGNIKHVESERLNWGIYQTKTTPLLSLLPHDISIVGELFGYESLTVNAASQRTFTNNVVPDYINFSGTVGKVSFNITGSWYWPTRTRKLTIIGDSGHIVWDDNRNTVEVFTGNVNNRRLSDLVLATTYTPNDPVSPLGHELNHFISCLVNKTTPKSDCVNAINVATVIASVQALLATESQRLNTD
jgi:predicted dehydrogenase